MKCIKYLFLLSLLLTSCSSKLPYPEVEEGIRGQQFGIDKTSMRKQLINI